MLYFSQLCPNFIHLCIPVIKPVYRRQFVCRCLIILFSFFEFPFTFFNESFKSNLFYNSRFFDFWPTRILKIANGG
ncbi:hypothetical protein DJ84_21945 [Halorubrum ezzemoulense]|nr:hypothetical protein DJ84_21945 [Halorubrum ezzemoulense]